MGEEEKVIKIIFCIGVLSVILLYYMFTRTNDQNDLKNAKKAIKQRLKTKRQVEERLRAEIWNDIHKRYNDDAMKNYICGDCFDSSSVQGKKYGPYSVPKEVFRKEEIVPLVRHIMQEHFLIYDADVRICDYATEDFFVNFVVYIKNI